MKVHLQTYKKSAPFTPPPFQPQVLFVFGGGACLREWPLLGLLRRDHPAAAIFGCSTAGEIAGTQVTEDAVVIAAVSLEKSTHRCASESIRDSSDSYRAGTTLGESLRGEDIAGVFVLSDGLGANGSDLVRGLNETLPEGTIITGGLAGDGDRFNETYIIVDGKPVTGKIAAIGFYGKSMRVGYGSRGGWDPFGPERIVTQSAGNILYTLDNKSALDLYKRYLGDHARGLPSTGLYFPLSIRQKDGETRLVRTILGINEKDHSMTFAGDMPAGSFAQFMKANIDRLINGATDAALMSLTTGGFTSPELALCISCVGRKMVLKQRVEEEVEAIGDIFGPDTAVAGFYSYGEISPSAPGAKSELHNQTMTITSFLER